MMESLRLPYSASMDGSDSEVVFGPSPASRRGQLARWRLFAVLCRVFGPGLLVSWFCKLIFDLLSFANPVLLRALLQFTHQKQEPAWHGWVYASAFLGLALVAAVAFNQSEFIGHLLSLRMRSALASAVFKKVRSSHRDFKL